MIYLSPSTQEYNPYATSGNEEEYMNLLTDAIEPLLRARGISYARNNPEGNVRESTEESNQGAYQLHLALHSNASPSSLAGQRRGVEVYFYPGSESGKRAADIMVSKLKSVYPGSVRALPSTSMYELRNTRAPAILLELGYHDNIEDEKWLKDNLEKIAQAIADGVAEFVGK